MRSPLRTAAPVLATLLTAALGPLLLLPVPALAQGNGTIVGHVTTETGAPLPSATVSIPGTPIGAASNDQGAYRIVVSGAQLGSGSLTLMVRRIGYLSRSATVHLRPGTTITQDFSLTAVPNQLRGVVISALGVERQKSQLGTAQQEISAKELNTTRAQNFVDQLAGKVSGLTVTGTGTPGGSTKIVIRGSNSVNGNNSPLFIVDGVPVSSDDRGSSPGAGSLGNSVQTGIDLGSVINDINPDDIASISVLKGPNAAALYGSRAANGAIIITTKHGQASNGQMRTQLTSTYTWDRPSIYMDWQNLYGQGSAGNFLYKDGQGGGINDGYDQSYGPRMIGQLIPQFDSPIVNGVRQATPFIPHPNNVTDFFNTGRDFATTIAVSGGTERASGRFSLGNTEIQGVIPNNTFHTLSGALAGTFRLNRRFTTTASVEYARNQAHNRPGVGYNTSALEQFIWFGRQVNMNNLRAKQYDANGNLYNWNLNFHNNPFWLQYDNPEFDQRDRIIASASGTYQVASWLNATLRGGQDYYNWDINRDFAAGNIQYSDPNYGGAFSLMNQYNSENNLDLLLNASRSVNRRLSLTGLLGGTIRTTSFHNSNTYTAGISVPGIYNVSNAAITPSLLQFASRRQVNSIYGSASFTWDGWWTVEGTGRNDWSSTLPAANNSYFYPGINTSVVLTDAIPGLRSRVLSYAKLRAAYARVGADADPYQLLTVYNGLANKFGSLPQYSLSNNLANANLKPELTTSSEGGAELAFFNNRVTLDGSIYDKRTRNQVLNLVIPPSSGFSTQSINAGEIENKGLEATIGVTPIRSDHGLSWTSTFNYAHNRSKVVSLSPGLSTVVLGSQWSATVEAQVGQPYGEIVGYTFLRDAQGNLLTENGMPIRGKRTNLGNVNPDWVGGWNNSFTYKRLTLSALLDIHHGGQIFSITNMMCEQSGTCASTLRGRQVDWNKPGIVVKGIDRTTGQPNTINVTSEQYFQSLWLIHQAYIYNDSYVKLREVRLGVDLPQSFANHLNAQAVNVSLVGRNLWTHSSVPNIDPEFTYSTGNFQGMEFAGLPTNRSIGLSVQVTP